MRSFFEWFKGSTKVKRWMFLILCGVSLTCYSFAQILVTKEIAVSELLKVIGMFVLGFLAIVIGIVIGIFLILTVLLVIMIFSKYNNSSKIIKEVNKEATFYVLVYDNSCKTCKRIIEMLKEEKIMRSLYSR